jgi:hypothetical protein
MFALHTLEDSVQGTPWMCCTTVLAFVQPASNTKSSREGDIYFTRRKTEPDPMLNIKAEHEAKV